MTNPNLWNQVHGTCPHGVTPTTLLICSTCAQKKVDDVQASAAEAKGTADLAFGGSMIVIKQQDKDIAELKSEVDILRQKLSKMTDCRSQPGKGCMECRTCLQRVIEELAGQVHAWKAELAIRRLPPFPQPHHDCNLGQAFVAFCKAMELPLHDNARECRNWTFACYCQDKALHNAFEQAKKAGWGSIPFPPTNPTS